MAAIAGRGFSPPFSDTCTVSRWPVWSCTGSEPALAIANVKMIERGGYCVRLAPVVMAGRSAPAPPHRHILLRLPAFSSDGRSRARTGDLLLVRTARCEGTEP